MWFFINYAQNRPRRFGTLLHDHYLILIFSASDIIIILNFFQKPLDFFFIL